MADLWEPLTDREREILTCLVNGLSNAEIASLLHLTQQTVRWYNSQIYSKLDAKNRQEAATKATALGLLDHLQSVEEIRHNLPVQTTPFIGRQKELAELARLLASEDTRLITILAPGGMGKTRLAHALCALLIKRKYRAFADGIFFVAMQPLADPQYIVSQIANSIGLQFADDNREPKQQLLDYLATQKLLLLMDNWENMLEAASLITDMLHAAPNLHILATSREKLNLSGETVYSLKSMDIPTSETAEDVLQYDAVRLLIQGIQRVKPDWTLTEGNLNAVVRVCHLTQGMPLGIVLAASWLDTLSITDVANEIQQSLDFLATDMRDLSSYQRSIRIVFEYTWRRLSETEQQVFMKLSVFRGGFTRQAAQAVADTNARVLQALVNKALITRDNQGRYDIHELLRQYAEERLVASDQSEATYDSHLRYFADFLYQRDAALKGHQQVETIEEIEADFDNVRRMWTRAIETQNHVVFYQSAETLCWYCFIAPHLIEGAQLFNAACTALEEKLDNKNIGHLWSHLQLRLFWIRIALYGSPKPYDKVKQQLEQWLSIAESANNQLDIALCHSFLSVVATVAGTGDALRMLEENVTRFEQLGNKFYLAWSFDWLRFYWEERSVETSLTYIRQSLELQRELGGQYGLAGSLFQAAYAALELGDLKEAIAYAKEIETLNSSRLPAWSGALRANIMLLQGDFDSAHQSAMILSDTGAMTNALRARHFANEQLGLLFCVYGDYQAALNHYEQILRMNLNPRHLYYANWLLALAACGLDDYPTAIKAIHDALQSSIQIGAIGRITWCLPATAMIEIHRGNYRQAVQILSLAFNHPKSATGWLEEWPLMGKLKDQLREELGEEQYEKVWEDSKSLDLVQVVSDWLSMWKKM